MQKIPGKEAVTPRKKDLSYRALQNMLGFLDLFAAARTIFKAELKTLHYLKKSLF